MGLQITPMAGLCLLMFLSSLPLPLPLPLPQFPMSFIGPVTGTTFLLNKGLGGRSLMRISAKGRAVALFNLSPRVSEYWIYGCTAGSSVLNLWLYCRFISTEFMAVLRVHQYWIYGCTAGSSVLNFWLYCRFISTEFMDVLQVDQYWIYGCTAGSSVLNLWLYCRFISTEFMAVLQVHQYWIYGCWFRICI